MWESMESDAYLLGVPHDVYWGSTPKFVIDVCNKKIKQMEQDRESQLEMAKYQAYLTMVGYHDPKKFPTDNNKNTAPKTQMDDNLQEANLLAIKKMFG